MIGLLIAAIVMVVLAMGLLYRIFKGPTVADRVAALDTLDLVISLALAMNSRNKHQNIIKNPTEEISVG